MSLVPAGDEVGLVEFPTSSRGLGSVSVSGVGTVDADHVVVVESARLGDVGGE